MRGRRARILAGGGLDAAGCLYSRLHEIIFKFPTLADARPQRAVARPRQGAVHTQRAGKHTRQGKQLMAGWITTGATVMIAFVAVVSAMRLQTRERVQDTRTRILEQARFLHTLGVSQIQKMGDPYFPRPRLATLRRHRWTITAILSDHEDVRDVTFLHSRRISKSEAIEGMLQGIYAGAVLDKDQKKQIDSEGSLEARLHYENYGLSLLIFIQRHKPTRLEVRLIVSLAISVFRKIINQIRRIYNGKK